MAISNGYCTLAEAKEQLGIDSSDSTEDSFIEPLVEAASREIDAFTGQFFHSASSETRYYTSFDGVYVYVDPIQSLTALTSDADNDNTYETTWATTGSDYRYRLEPVNASTNSESYWRLHAITANWPTTSAAIKAAGTFGWATVPKQIREACLLQTARLFVRRSAPFGIVEAQDGGMMQVRGGLDRQVKELIERYRAPTMMFA